MDFKVGDIIKGKSNDYMWTNERMKRAKVLKADENDMTIEVIEVIEHFVEFINGKRFTVKNSTKYFELIEEKEFTKSDLKDGDIVTRRDKNKGIVNKRDKKIIRLDNKNMFIPLSNYTEDLKNTGGAGKCLDIIKVERPTEYETVFETVFERVEEEKKEILDRIEKNYLTNVIKPFKENVKYIVKADCYKSKSYESIEICLENNDCMLFPDFEKGTMYKGMELRKRYTLEELGI